jgi:hypothetical protein
MAEQVLSLGLVAMPLSKATRRSVRASLALWIGLRQSLELTLLWDLPGGLAFQWATQPLNYPRGFLHAQAASSLLSAQEPLPK